MNIKLLQQIKRQILRRPKQFTMDDLFSNFTELGNEASHCGTAACIAGWAFTLGEGIKNPMLAKTQSGVMERAEELLEISPCQANTLFYCDAWPDQFRPGNAESDAEFARLAAARIDHFIATDGKE